MHIWTDLLSREGALLVLLLALGAMPAAFLPARFDAATRLALTPIFGFCLGTCVATTVLQFGPADDTYWMLIPCAALSLGVGIWRVRRSNAGATTGGGLTLRDVVQLLVVCVAVAGPLTHTLHARHSVGPAGFIYTDVDNYVSEEDGAQTTSIRDARRAWAHSQQTGSRFADLTQWDWSFFASFNANPNSAPLDANLDVLLSLGATDTNSAFLIVLLLAGALGAFAMVRYLTGSRTWMAALAGALFGGPMFLELWFDTFQAAIIALALVMPYMILGGELLRARSFANLALFALVLATLFAVYPVLVPILLAAGALVVACRTVASARTGRDLRQPARSAAAGAGVLAALVIVFANINLLHVADYYKKLVENLVPLPRVGWHLPLDVLPGWLFQTQEFWNMPGLGSANFKQIVLGAVLPLVFLGFIALGLRRHQPALALVALAGVCAAAAEYAFAAHDACTYCAERDLLPLGPIVAVLVALGLTTLLAMPQRWARVLGLVGAILVVVAVGRRAHFKLQRFSNGAYFLDSADRSVLGHLPRSPAAVQIEGFGQTTKGQAEQPLVYALVNEHARGRVSIGLGSNVNNSIEYLDFGVVKPPGPEFHPEYDYVVTRFAGIETDRVPIARSGGVALERRTQTLDVTPFAGLVAPLERLDRSGKAWLDTNLPLQLYVTGAVRSPVWARLVFDTSVPVTVSQHDGIWSQRGDVVTTCIPAKGPGPVRQTSLEIKGATGPAPSHSVALTAMRAVAGHCAD